MFVQFDDGSVWGDATVIADVMFQRTDAIKYLKSLRDAYSEGGDYALYQALRASVPSTGETDHRPRIGVHSRQLTLQQLPNGKAVVDRIDKDLATAEEHTAWLR
jgi:hypothetical protein